MKLILDNNRLNEAPARILRQAGYAFLIDRSTGKESYVRGFGRGYYPRFHLYLAESDGQVIINLHLDQKQASYAGAHMHNAEYDGETVAAETQRIKCLMDSSRRLTPKAVERDLSGRDILDQIRHKRFPPVFKKEEKKSWWKFWK